MEYKVYRWANGQVIDTFTGTKEECAEYCKKWRNYICETIKI